MNASNHIAARVTEMEVAMNLAGQYKRCGNMDQALDTCRSTFNLPHLEAVGVYVQRYSGGDNFVLVKLLVELEKIWNSSMMLGQDFFTAVATTDLGSAETTFPLVRTMLLAAALSSPKHADGISRLLSKQDVEKLKSNVEQAVLAEKMAMLVFSQVGQGQALLDNKRLLGRFLVRGALWLTKKEGKGREKTVFGSLEEIHKAFLSEQAKAQASSSTGDAGGSAVAESKVLGLEEACMLLVLPERFLSNVIAPILPLGQKRRNSKLYTKSSS